jgi:ribosomal protein S12 methylthiotransferase accessory factor
MEIYFEGGKKVNVSYHGMIHKTDQLVKSGGEGTAPTPFDLFLASIGACAGIFVKEFCDKRGIDTNAIKLVQHMQFDPIKHLMTKIDIEIQVTMDFPEKYESAMINTANLCTVKRHLSDEIKMSVYVTRM